MSIEDLLFEKAPSLRPDTTSFWQADGDSTKALYGKDLSSKYILTGKVQPPASAHTFLASVAHAKSESVAKKAEKNYFFGYTR